MRQWLGPRRHEAQLAEQAPERGEVNDRAGSSLGAEHPYIAISLDNLGSAVLGQGRADEALGLLRSGLAMHRKLVGDDHPRVAVSLRREAEALAALSRTPEAIVAVEEALALLGRLSEPPAAELAAATALRERLGGKPAGTA